MAGTLAAAGAATAGAAQVRPAPPAPLVISPDEHLYTAAGEYVWTPQRVKGAWEAAYAQLAAHVHAHPCGSVTLVGGLPGAGKTTYLARLTGQGAAGTRQQRQNRRGASAGGREADEREAGAGAGCTGAGMVYFDATFTNAWGRAKLIETARRASASVRIHMVFLDTAPSVCFSRNAARSQSRMVPRHALARMARSLRSEGLPARAEGFESVAILKGAQRAPGGAKGNSGAAPRAARGAGAARARSRPCGGAGRWQGAVAHGTGSTGSTGGTGVTGVTGVHAA